MPLIDDEVRITLRLPESLRDRTAAAAKTSGRSLNSEIVAVLEQAFPDYSAAIESAIRTIETELKNAPEDKRTELKERLDALSNSIFR